MRIHDHVTLSLQNMHFALNKKISAFLMLNMEHTRYDT